MKGEAAMNTIRDVKIAETTVIERLHVEGALRRFIMDMGLTCGTEVYVRKVAPLGDPLELTMRGYALSLRKGDVENIQMRRADHGNGFRSPFGSIVPTIYVQGSVAWN